VRQRHQVDQWGAPGEDSGATRAIFILEPDAHHGVLAAELEHVPDILQGLVHLAVPGKGVAAAQVGRVETCHARAF
jgi:hypothetical protein